jgi:phosphatidylserine/phosphatidylglycerophosphate/cardiolipin synthase-like enzyme
MVAGAAWTEKESETEGPQPEIHYVPRENLESLDARAIRRAELSIDIAAYVLSDPRIIEALTDAAERGVLIRLYLDRSQFAEHGPTRGGLVEALLAHPNVVARVKGEGVLMHLKAYAVDGTVLRTGSGNFSRSGLASQDNDAIFITDPLSMRLRAISSAFGRARKTSRPLMRIADCRAHLQSGPSAERFRNQAASALDGRVARPVGRGASSIRMAARLRSRPNASSASRHAAAATPVGYSARTVG